MIDVTGKYDETNYPGNKKSSLLFKGKVTPRDQVIREVFIDPDNCPNSEDVGDYKVTYPVVITQPEHGVIVPVNGRNQESYGFHEEVEFEVIPDENYDFDSWTDDLAGENNPVKIRIGNSLGFGSSVEGELQAVTVGISSDGDYASDPDFGDFIENEEHDRLIPYGTVLGLTATPDENFEFDSWTGDVPEGHTGDNPLILTITGPIEINATFSAV